jgi:intein/homing endonuclease
LSCDFEVNPCRVTVECADGHNVNNFQCDCGSSCLLAGTEITMADGSKKPIESIAVGDVVLAYDEKTGEMKPDRVKVVYEPADSPGYLVINGSLKLTMIHPVLTPDGFKEIGKLKVGDRLVGADKKEIEIASIERKGDHVTVYNFHTNPYETYVANGVIVHNKNPYIPTDGE